MKVFLDKYEDQTIDPADVFYKVDQEKLVKWLKHMRKLNSLLKNDLSRDDEQRRIDTARFDVYDGLLGFIRRGDIITK